MSCSLCESVPLKRLKHIDRHLKSGEKSLMAIADRYGVDIGELRRHLVQCVDGPVAPQADQELEGSLGQLRAIITQFQQDIADGQHLRFNPEDGIDGRSTVTQMIAAMREFRETVLALQRIRTADAIYKDLRETVVDPMIHAVVQICTDEARRLRDELFDLTKGSSDQHHAKIKAAVDESLLRIGDRMGTEALQDIADKVKAVAGQRGQRNRPAAH